MGLFSRTNKHSSISWQQIDSVTALAAALDSANESPALFFKHSTRCSISSMALSRLEGSGFLEESGLQLYFIDLIQYRDVSQSLSELSNVTHQSPQVIVIKHGNVVYHASHGAIDVQQIIQSIQS